MSSNRAAVSACIRRVTGVAAWLGHTSLQFTWVSLRDPKYTNCHCYSLLANRPTYNTLGISGSRLDPDRKITDLFSTLVRSDCPFNRLPVN